MQLKHARALLETVLNPWKETEFAIYVLHLNSLAKIGVEVYIATMKAVGVSVVH